MNIRFLHIAFAAAALLAPWQASAEKTKTVLDLKQSISDSNIVYPESFEADTQKMLEGWYMKNYTATDDRWQRQPDVQTDDEVIRTRLSQLNTVVELPFNQIVRSYIERYTKYGRAQVAALLGLSNYYMPIFEQALEEQGLPLELKYLPVIESSLNPNAVSKHGAAGLWQFMLATGRGLDLEISSLVDERRDPYLSSHKAAKLLKDLYAAYGDWTLAIAAYNCGPGTLNKAIRRAGGDPSKHDFWSVYYYLPEETRGYVPQFIAANYVMNYYPYHNISPVLSTKPLITDTVMVADRVHFEQISHVLDIPVDEIRVLNPQFRRDIIPGRADKMYTLVLPSQQIQAYIMSHEDILAYDADKYAPRLEVAPGDGSNPDDLMAAVEPDSAADDAPLEQPVLTSETPVRRSGGGNGAGTKTVSHKVEPGETLSSIATKYNVSVADLKSWNNLTRNSVRTGQKLRVTADAALADASGAKEVAQPKSHAPKTDNWKKDNTKNTADSKTDKKSKNTKASKGKEAAKKPAVPSSHTVKSGENLSTIAKKYGTTAAELKKVNGLKDDNIHPGDALKLPGKGKSAQTKSGSKGKSKTQSASKTKSSKSKSRKKRK